MKKILINHTPWQTRAAILDDGQLQDVYFDSESVVDLERCFFKGKISKIIPGLQTAFVDINQEKAGFLHISEVDRVLAAERIAGAQQLEGIDGEEYTPRTVKKVMDIRKVFKEGEHVLVQVIKEPVYEKGAKLTTCFTLPGKFLVLMPNIPQIGVSKKIEDRAERQRLREVVRGILPKGMGAIVRTTSEYRPTHNIEKDVKFLLGLWESIQERFKTAESGEMLFQDIPLSERVIREHLTDEVEDIITDSATDKQTLTNFIQQLMPEYSNKLRVYTGDQSLFEKYGVARQVDNALQKKVQLPSGGSLIIETTEAMTVIDVNTGRYTGKNNLEETILKTNLEAATEVVIQLRLRNIGGLIVIDFIDMSQAQHRQQLSSHLEKTLKEKDKFQSVTLKVSEFGLVQMTRKRSGKTLSQQLMRDCHCCRSLGYIPSFRTLSYEIFTNFSDQVKREALKGPFILCVSREIFEYVVNNEHHALLSLSKNLKSKIVLELDEKLIEGEYRIAKHSS